MLNKCYICPHLCGVNRDIGNIGRCKANSDVKIALSTLHNFEEPCISGTQGSGTIFFSNCNLNCVFCQNYKISQEGFGKVISIQYLASLFILQQEKGAHNVNLVSPTIYVPQIIQAISIARNNGFNLPIIYNSSGYENIDTLKLLNGYIDIYLPDLKYFDPNLSFRMSGVKDYFNMASNAIKEMYRQVGSTVLNENKIMQKGLMIRHMILPNNIKDSKNILKWINENMPKDIYISIMAQYFPTYKAKNIDEINRKITSSELKDVQDYLFSLDLENGYIQELSECEEEYVPKFNIDTF